MANLNKLILLNQCIEHMSMDSPSRKPINTEEQENSLFQSAFLIDHKAEYIKKPKNMVDTDPSICTICKIIRRDESIKRMEIYRDSKILVFLNIYPYTAGHLLISPLDHIVGFEDMDSETAIAFVTLLQRCIAMLKHFGGTDSLNVGWNQGEWSGGSIPHFHAHLVPRYKNDINFVDIIAKSRPVIQALEDTERKLLKYREFLSGEKTISEIFD